MSEAGLLQKGLSPQPPELTLTWVMRIHARCGPPHVLGRTPDGQRSNYPILGGSFVGTGLSGELLPGTDFFRLRDDGVGVLDAHYALRCEDGTIVNVHNRGLYMAAAADDATARQLPDGMRYRCHCTPVFEAPEGACEFLNRSVFAGSVSYPAEGEVLIDVYRLG